SKRGCSSDVCSSDPIIETGRLKELRHITRIEYVVQAKGDLELLKDLPYVHDFDEREENTHLRVDNDKAAEFLEALHPIGPTHLETLPPRLEDIFMRYYEGRSDES